MAAGMGIKAHVNSPTFTIVNEYLGPRPLFHFDMYRLRSAEELFDIGWEDYLGRGGVCVVEWSENVAEAFDGTEWRVSIDKLGETARRITIEEGSAPC
jgi:tRNA threonylcarbamoyladenosine biosynthesis protein TsaE